MKVAKEKILKFSVLLNIILLLGMVFVFVRGDASRIAVKFGLQEPVVTVNRTQEAWDNSLIQLPQKPDIVFIGDSLTYHCDFQSYFPDHLY